MPKTDTAALARVLPDIPSIGVSIAKDLRGLGIATPSDVAAMGPRQLWGPSPPNVKLY